MKLGGSSCCTPPTAMSYRMVSCDVRDIKSGGFEGRGCGLIAATHGSEREREDIRWCRAASQPETGPAESAYGMSISACQWSAPEAKVVVTIAPAQHSQRFRRPRRQRW